jgi:glutamate-1-semialdehyde 2,1-aminomutase
MQQVAPLGPVYQAGTLSGNPLAMAAGIATLRELFKPGRYEELERKGRLLEEGMLRAIHNVGGELHFARLGSLFGLFFTPQAVIDYASAKTSDTARYARYFWKMLERRMYLPPSQFETCFISLALDDAMIEETVQHVEEALHEVEE